jgi:hypothetical protein
MELFYILNLKSKRHYSLDCSLGLNPEIDCMLACLSAGTVQFTVTAETNLFGVPLGPQETS